MDIRNNRIFRFKYWGLIAWSMVIISVAVFFNLYGIYLLDNLENWQAWRAETYGYFLTWRLAVYAFIVRGWIPIRKQMMEREPEMSWRLKRMEVVITFATILFEVSRAQAHGVWGAA